MLVPEPFRVFFPLGLFAGFLGVGIWIPLRFELIEAYPGAVHPDLMIDGFLAAFATGFLMTAIPRFTGGGFARRSEVGASLGCILGTVLLALVSLWMPDLKWLVHLTSALNILFLVSFAQKRFIVRKNALPPTFVFVGVGLLLGGAGAILLSFYELGWIGDDSKTVFRQMHYIGMPLSLVMGIGGKLIPHLMGVGAGPLEKPSPKEHAASRLVPFLAILYLHGFVVELLGYEWMGRAARAVVVTWVASKYWHLFKRRPRRGPLSFGVWASSISLLAGSWAVIFFPDYSLHLLHLIFISGFTLLTLMIAIRVTLSHGGHSIREEEDSKRIWCIIAFILAAAIGRVFAPLSAKGYLPHLAYAAIVWIIAEITWFAGYFKKLIRLG